MGVALVIPRRSHREGCDVMLGIRSEDDSCTMVSDNCDSTLADIHGSGKKNTVEDFARRLLVRCRRRTQWLGSVRLIRHQAINIVARYFLLRAFASTNGRATCIAFWRIAWSDG